MTTEATRSGRLGEAARRLALLAASVSTCVLVLSGAELLLRTLRPSSLAHAPALQPHVFSPDYGWALRPGYSGRTRDGRLVSINRLGFRGPAPETWPKAGRRRILMLGDSITFGTGVLDDETFTARLAALAPDLEPFNLGVSGYGTDQELLLLEREGLALAPFAVVVNVCVGNDALDNALPVYLYDGVTPKPFFTAEGDTLLLHDAHVRLQGPALFARRLLERSLVFDALLRLGDGGRGAPLDHDEGEHWGPRARVVLERWPEAVSLSRRLLARVAERCEARGVRLVVALHPNRRTFEGDLSLLEPFRTSSLTLDLGAHYARAGLAWDELALDKLGHLSRSGHLRAAEALAAALPR